jgi:hypothetical protein
MQIFERAVLGFDRVARPSNGMRDRADAPAG